MTTPCPSSLLPFHPLARREVVGRVEAGRLPSEAGGIRRRDVDQRRGLRARLAACVREFRQPGRTDPPVGPWMAPRVEGMALGDEDLHDHEAGRADRLWALRVGKTDRSGAPRRRARDRGEPWAASSPLHRLAWGPPEEATPARDGHIVAEPAARARVRVDVLLDSDAPPPEARWREVDAPDEPLPGEQEGRFFHGDSRPSCD